MKAGPIHLALMLLAAGAQAQDPQDPGAAASRRDSVIGYPTVQAASESLRAQAGAQVQVTKPDGWMIVTEPGGVQWSFTPDGHYAHPAVVRRAVKVNAEGRVFIEMSALCQAEKAPCDKLMEEFNELNEKIRQTVRSRVKQ